jgi:hypothetical protein
LTEPPEDWVKLAQSGERVLCEVGGGVAPTRRAVVALIRGFPQEPIEPKVRQPISESEPEAVEEEPAPTPPTADPVEEKIRNLERAGLWDPGR